MDLKELARQFWFLSDPTRLRLLGLLVKGPKNVTALCKEVGLKQPIVSTHLGLLRRGGLVNAERESVWMIYSMNKAAMKALAAAMARLTPK